MQAVADVAEVQDRSWREWRRMGIGASEAAGVAGISPWSSPISVWLDKVGLAADLEPTEAMRWGLLLEPVIIEEFQLRTGLAVFDRQVLVEHATERWMRATLDGYVADAVGSDPLGVFESKTSGDWNRSIWDEGVPAHYLLQVQHQMAITDLPVAYVVALLGGQKLTTFLVERDQEAIDLLMEIEDTFWRKYVLTRQPPPVDGSERTTEAIKQAFANPALEQVELDESDLALVRQIEAADAEEKAAKERGDLWRNAIRLRLGDAEVGVYRNAALVTWKQVQQERLDVEALRTAEPALAARFTKPAVYRRLLFPRRRSE